MNKDEDQLLDSLLRRTGEDFREAYPQPGEAVSAVSRAVKIDSYESFWERCAKWLVVPSPAHAVSLGFAALVLLVAGAVMRESSTGPNGSMEMQLAAVSGTEREFVSFGEDTSDISESEPGFEEEMADFHNEEEELLPTYQEFREELAQVIEEHYPLFEDEDEIFNLAPEYIPLVIG